MGEGDHYILSLEMQECVRLGPDFPGHLGAFEVWERGREPLGPSCLGFLMGANCLASRVVWNQSGLEPVLARVWAVSLPS